jgi:hypothetical protein
VPAIQIAEQQADRHGLRLGVGDLLGNSVGFG